MEHLGLRGGRIERQARHRGVVQIAEREAHGLARRLGAHLGNGSEGRPIRHAHAEGRRLRHPEPGSRSGRHGDVDGVGLAGLGLGNEEGRLGLGGGRRLCRRGVEGHPGGLRQVQLVARRGPGSGRRGLLQQAQEQEGAGDLGGLELVEAGQRRSLLERALAVEPLGQLTCFRPQLGHALAHFLGGREHHSEAFEVPEHEAAVGQAGDCGENELFGRELEIDGALGQDSVFELEAARGVGDDVGENPLDLDPRRIGQLALVDVTALGQHLGQRVAGPHLGVDVVELLLIDLPALDEDGPELILRVVRGTEENAAAPEVESLRVRRTFHLERAGGSLTVQVREKEGKSFGVDVPADGERLCQSSLRAREVWADHPRAQHITTNGRFVDTSWKRPLHCFPRPSAGA